MCVSCAWKAVVLFFFVSTISAVKWPAGTYTLIKPDTGCPSNWLEGWRFQDNENDNNKNRIDREHHFFGITEQKPSNFNFSYCTKAPINLGSEGNWPPGSYCIIRHGNTCPGGFENGSIFWDDENDNNNNSVGGVLPSGQYGNDTMINYCCRRDGKFNSPIQLPTTQPFHLLKFVYPCQMVKGTNVKEIRIDFDDENDHNKDHAYGMHPFGPYPGKEDNLLVYCYYSPTK
ncbi:uncharacterized protein LOC125648717 [Ostrea edulis]|uniref:uncharacterized protein LOC125648717 n=1 Tax=Ostrea edulis TaxID=37623 RepID=UPI0024AFF046|nr:uncharacterized protein LOC125648717 [Ostrea edulis]